MHKFTVHVSEKLTMVPRFFSTVFSELRTARKDRAFRVVLTHQAQMGIMVGGVLGLAAVAIYVGMQFLMLGKAPAWTYGEEYIVLWDKTVLVGLCLVAIAVGRRLTLNAARLLVGALVFVGAIASVADDVSASNTSFSPGYLTFMYLLAVAAVPYRPWQTLGLGAALAFALYGVVEFFPVLTGVSPVEQNARHYIYLVIICVLFVGVSGLLYLNRYRQYRARRDAERLREQVQRLEAAKSRFFANISHEFRTPLTLILGPTEDVLAGRYGAIEPRLKRRVREMHVQAKRLRTLIDQLLDLSKLEASAMPLHLGVHDLGRFVQRQAEPFRSAAQRAAVTLQVETPDAALNVPFDAEKMERVVSNLLSNAVKHTPAGGTVRIRVEEGEEEAVISVRDSGAGLTPAQLQAAFDRFVSSEGPRGGQPSTGIGLALVKEVVEHHEGRVDATSEPGFGAEFVVSLPMRAAQEETDKVSGSATAGSATAGSATEDGAGGDGLDGKHGGDLDAEENSPAGERTDDDAPLVFVVDDDAPVRAYLRDLLADMYRVAEMADGAAAWDRLQQQRPALLISDVMMPGLDGFELCRRVRSDERLADLPILLLTARAEEEARVEGWRMGADAYLTKPFSGRELRVVTEHLIEVRQLLRERIKVPDWMNTKAPSVSPPSAEFLDRVQQVVGDHIGDSNFTVDWLASEVGLSARQLQRRLKKLTRLTAAGFIKTMRLEHAAQLLAEKDLQVQEVAHAVGYEDANYFSRLFRETYGMPPSEYAKGEA